MTTKDDSLDTTNPIHGSRLIKHIGITLGNTFPCTPISD